MPLTHPVAFDVTQQLALCRVLFDELLVEEEDEIAVYLTFELFTEVGIASNLRNAQGRVWQEGSSSAQPFRLVSCWALELSDGTLFDRHFNMGEEKIEAYTREQAEVSPEQSWRFSFWAARGDTFYSNMHRDRFDHSFHADWNLHYNRKLDRYRTLFQAFLLSGDTTRTESDTPHHRL